ncbi:patatin-08-like [Vicia villosa]|uniref:patatin-08-like n=1 Tax=Vicia villosa TaxID=3911 RepID=UPI00273A8B53|nr:patatin-08-like [Vicia villosa]
MAKFFLLFVFVFASQVIGGLNTKLPSPSYGNTISILSIDAGGIKGILPTVVLEHLEYALQIVSRDEKAALADYFDVIAGTSMGGIITGMLTTPNPNDNSRPLFTTNQILRFFLDFGPSIFNLTSANNWDHDTRNAKFDGKFLYEKIRELLQETRLHETLTNVVIPTFDILDLHPVIFSSFKLKTIASLDAKLSDICLGTSAAPYEVPPYSFKNGDKEFNLVDGILTAASPALLAVSEVIQQLNEKNSDFVSIKANEPIKIVLLSLGTGTDVEKKGIPASLAQSLTYNEWLPVLAADYSVSAGKVNDYHLESVFPSDSSSSDNYYLRIEEYNLDSAIAPDDASKEKVEKLLKTGDDLLKQFVKVMNVTSFLPYEKPSEGTNAEALERLAEILYNERQLRLKRKSMEKQGRPFIEAIPSTFQMT